ncbi:WD repeat-containing protein 91 [Geodia barretti]|uniref:WD repeat-containing protein 91 n=1 Tax=Geodia barretti TaxID=519541 RepID=A0AA35QV51_GEOBA|nr:WD repeat-containing protein 91 [Geodia barretti]
MAFAVGALDDAIREYLLFRGFTQTLKLFETERRDDKDKGFSFRVNRIVEYIMQCVFKSDFPSLQSFWSHLYGRFFSQMNSESLTMAYRLETNVLRLFLVQASKTGRHEEVRAFFEKMSDSLHDRKEWKDWFALPFTKNPDQHPTFRLYYSKEWLDTFQITLHNFFSTLFTSIPLPALLSFEAEHQKMQALSTENHHLHNQLAETRRAFTELGQPE